jgi:hypothetical protein
MPLSNKNVFLKKVLTYIKFRLAGMFLFMLFFFGPLILSDFFTANQAYPLVQWLQAIINLPVWVQSLGLAALVLAFLSASFCLSLFFLQAA